MTSNKDIPLPGDPVELRFTGAVTHLNVKRVGGQFTPEGRKYTWVVESYDRSIKAQIEWHDSYDEIPPVQKQIFNDAKGGENERR